MTFVHGRRYQEIRSIGAQGGATVEVLRRAWMLEEVYLHRDVKESYALGYYPPRGMDAEAQGVCVGWVWYS